MYPIVKRFFDFTFSLLGLIVLLPLLLPIAIGLKLTGEGEIFYKQNRIGYKNTHFGILKFATMLKNSSKIGTGAITVRNDPRVTVLGKYLRMTKINELPQLINVLLGTMSIVGPRPLMKVSFEQYADAVQKLVYNSPPGITGIGSIVFRDEEKIVSDSDNYETAYKKIYQHKGDLEMWYQKNKSFSTDFAIIFLTAWVIIFPTSTILYSIFKDLPKRNF
jgi:lipopolysaccharide/colanic/teichoic acid biosynthesis glycosyltransferase